MEHKKKSAGLCERIHNAVSPFRPRTPRISDHPRAPISVIADKSSVKNTSPQSKTIPVEFRHSAAHFSPQNSNNGEVEIAIIRGHKFAKSVSGKEKHAPPPPPHMFILARARMKIIIIMKVSLLITSPSSRTGW